VTQERVLLRWQSPVCEIEPVVRVVSQEPLEKAGHVLGRAPVHEVEILREDRHAENDSGHPPDDDELDPRLGQLAQRLPGGLVKRHGGSS
jgi:hypothetical protein